MAIEDGFDFSDLDNFQKKLLQKAQKEFPRETYRFMRKAGTKKKRYIKRRANQLVKKDKNNSSKEGRANYHKSWKRGKAYKRNKDNSYNVQVRNNSYHGHLIEYGHRQVTKDGKEVGFVPGKHVLEKASKEFQSQFYKMIEDWLDEMLEKGL
ncbi:HK97 gp10 family phage protein (plasmid) [Crassaminicella thermophila]|uniref:HK97 gp10 family phage protein n=1 Tax=Crassaminicella thermophila TaxID=2599308 RepID=A0A5C0SJW1_CRATE|nr:HK97 gp10 family phage protein [Crassaminicella thermophila]QEK13724.1 HK97 gp10 family phage protein [Crassaminicella thermophila]